MKTNSILAALCGVVLLGSSTSCTTSQQFFGATTGAALGGMFGSAIGGLSNGPRGSDLGTVVGMAIGGAIGAAATAPKSVESSSYYYNGYDQDDFYENRGYSPYSTIEVGNVRIITRDHSNTLVAGERAQLVFEVRNHGDNYVYNIAPVITVTGTKQIRLSPTAIINELAPGGAVRYKAEVMATRKLKRGVADFMISFGENDRLYAAYSFSLNTLPERR